MGFFVEVGEIVSIFFYSSNLKSQTFFKGLIILP
jgi:hypothetical protein